MADLKISALTASTTPLAGTEVLPIVQSSTTKQVSVANLTAGRAVSMISGTVGASPGAVTAPTNADDLVVQNTAAAGITILSPDANAGRIQFGTVSNNSNVTLYGQYNYGFDVVVNGSIVSHADTTTKDITVSLGNLIQGTAAKGINFTANTPAAGMTSQLLNWYEEGTWTPVLNRSSTAPSVTYTTQTGTYTRKGREVTLKGNLVWTANSGGTGYFTITGQPFVASATGLNSGVVGLLDGFTYAVGTTQIAVAIVSGGNFISFYTFGSAVGGSIVSTVANAGEVDICITYFV